MDEAAVATTVDALENALRVISLERTMHRLRHLRAAPRALALAFVLMLAACATAPEPESASAPLRNPDPLTVDRPASGAATSQQRSITVQSPQVRAYRKLGAGHIYHRYPNRIYAGKIPALVYAVVVVETHLDAHGNVTEVSFSRTPGHAAEVAPMIAALIRAASPLPDPGTLGAHTYVDVWLWDRSGNFQLATLTRGQLSR